MVMEKQPNNTTNYILHFDADGGENAPKNLTNTSDLNFTIFHLSNQQPTKDGYVFKGWADSQNLFIYQPGDYISIYSQETTLHAIWEQETTATSEQTEPLGVSTQSIKDTLSSESFISITFIAASSVCIIMLIVLLFREHYSPRILSNYRDDDDL